MGGSVPADSQEHAGGRPLQRVRRKPRILDGLPGHLKRQALLRIEVSGLARGDAEKLRVEEVDAVD